MVGHRRDEARQQIAVCHVQFEHVEPAGDRAARACDKLRLDAVHVGARHRARHLVFCRVGQCRGSHERPVARRQRMVHPLPTDLGRPFAAGMAQLHADFRAAVLMHEVDDARKCRLLRVVVQARATGRDACIRRRAGHLDEYEARAANRARAVVHQVPVGRHAIDSHVLRHGRDHDAIGQAHRAQLERSEHRGRREIRRQVR